MHLVTNKIIGRFFLIMLVVIVSSGCPSPTGDDDSSDGGSIALQVYSAALDPAEITDDYGLEPIVEVTPAINGRTVFVGDGSGNITITNVPAGTYTVHPTFLAPAADTEITVVNGQQTEKSIVLPETGLYYFAFDTTSSNVAEFRDTDVRIATGTGIVRQDLISAAGKDNVSAFDLIPPEFRHDGISESDGARVTETTSPTAIQPDALPSLSFEFLHNDVSDHASIAQEFMSQLESINSGIDVTITSVDWDTYLQRRADDDYDMIRAGWIPDANNIVNYLKTLAGHANYSSDTLTALVDQAETALNDGDLLTYTQKAIELHDHLISQMPVIPVYYY